MMEKGKSIKSRSKSLQFSGFFTISNKKAPIRSNFILFNRLIRGNLSDNWHNVKKT